MFKFRGKSIQTNEWLKGSHVKISGKDYIIPLDCKMGDLAYPVYFPQFEVHPDSVGMWTGLVDMHNIEIYTGEAES